MTSSDTRCHGGPTTYYHVEVRLIRWDEEEPTECLPRMFTRKWFGSRVEAQKDNDEGGTEHRSRFWEWKEGHVCEIGVQCATPRIGRPARHTSWNRSPAENASEVRACLLPMRMLSWDADTTQHARSKRLHHQSLANIVLLTAAQLACIMPLQNYNPCHENSPHEASHELLVCASFHNDLPPYLGLLEPTSATLFVFSAIAYGAVAMYEYHINRQDRYQQVFLVVGIVVGLLACWDAQRMDPARLAFCVSIGLLASACCHWVYAICLGPRAEAKGAMNSEKEAGIDVV
jgi:hypothetical protein